MSTKPRFYITTPIYYVNDVPHLGHAFEVIGIDVQARFRRLTGHEVRFLTGTDEHGQKIADTAKARGEEPRQWCDRLAGEFRRVWDLLKISYDDFIRTTEPRHHESVARLWKKVEANGDIYLDKYEGWYDVKEESFITETEMKEKGLEPDGERIKRMSEEAYFFRLGKYREQILRHIEENPDFIQPEIRRNEVVKSFLRPDMPDLSISRTSIDWGIPVPGAKGHVIYVWFDALTNYISAAGYGRDEEMFGKWWPADVHVIGKDILKFHCVYWPAMLLAGGVKLPKQVFGHGFITVLRPGEEGQEKMSKSAGNTVDPMAYVERIGVEPLRYLLMRELNYGSDGIFNEHSMIQRYNAELPNGLGNTLARTASLIERNLPDGIVRPIAREEMTEIEHEFVTYWEETVAEFERGMPRFEFQAVLGKVWGLIDLMNQRMNEVEPWKLAKDPAQTDRVRVFLSCVAEGLRGVGLLLSPFMPDASARIHETLGLSPEETPWEDARHWARCYSEMRVRKGEPLFKKLET